MTHNPLESFLLPHSELQFNSTFAWKGKTFSASNVKNLTVRGNCKHFTAAAFEGFQ